MRSYTIYAAVLAVIMGMLGGCVTTDHHVSMKTPNVDKPISASAFYLDQNGNVVNPQDYEVVHHFSDVKMYEGKIGKSTTSLLDIDAELRGIFEQYRADAIVNLKISAVDYDPGATDAAGILRSWGWATAVSFLITTVMWIYISPAADGQEGVDPYVYLFAGGTGVGVLMAGISYILPATSKSVWTISIEGDAVRHR